jgi:hypothetical protein
MHANWTDGGARLKQALENHPLLKAVFLSYSFLSLLLFVPTPVLGGTPVAVVAPWSAPTGPGCPAGAVHDDAQALFSPGGDPAALERGEATFKFSQRPIPSTGQCPFRPSMGASRATSSAMPAFPPKGAASTW